MLTIIFVGIMVALLVVGGVFAMMAKGNKRRGAERIATSTRGRPDRGKSIGTGLGKPFKAVSLQVYIIADVGFWAKSASSI